MNSTVTARTAAPTATALAATVSAARPGRRRAAVAALLLAAALGTAAVVAATAQPTGPAGARALSAPSDSTWR